MNKKVTDEMLRYVGGLWPDAAKEKQTQAENKLIQEKLDLLLARA